MQEYVLDGLIEAAAKETKFAYVPLTEKPIGAALLADEGEVYTSSNVELQANLGVSAELLCLYKALNSGESNFKALVVYNGGNGLIFPSGAALQAFSEFVEDMQIIVCCDTNMKKYSLRELLPRPFKSED